MHPSACEYSFSTHVTCATMAWRAASESSLIHFYHTRTCHNHNSWHSPIDPSNVVAPVELCVLTENDTTKLCILFLFDHMLFTDICIQDSHRQFDAGPSPSCTYSYIRRTQDAALDICLLSSGAHGHSEFGLIMHKIVNLFARVRTLHACQMECAQKQHKNLCDATPSIFIIAGIVSFGTAHKNNRRRAVFVHIWQFASTENTAVCQIKLLEHSATRHPSHCIHRRLLFTIHLFDDTR